MFSEERTFNEFEQIVSCIETFYQEAYQKSVSILDIVKSSCDKIKCSNGKKNGMLVISSLFPMEFFQRVWETGANKVYHPEEELFVFNYMKGRIKQFTGQFKEIKKSIKISQKQANKLNSSLISLIKLSKDYDDPIIYYNDIQRIKDKSVLLNKLNSYQTKKSLFISQKQQQQKTLTKLSQLYNSFNKQIFDNFSKIILVFNKLGQNITSIIHQFFYYTIDSILKQIQKIEKIQISKQRKLSFSSQISSNIQKHLYQTKTLLKYKTQQLKINQTIFLQIRVTIDGFYSIKKHLQKQLFQFNTFKQKINSIFPKLNFFDSYKSSLQNLISAFDSYINSFKSILEYYPSLQKLDILKTSSLQSLKKIVMKQTNKNNTKQMKQMLQIEIMNIEQIEEESNKILIEVLLYSMNSLYEEMRQIDGRLKQRQGDKQLVFQNFKIMRDQFKMDIVIDEDFEKQIRQRVGQQQEQNQIDKENVEKVYSCALDGKIHLAGKLKLFNQGIGFQSVFNQKNLFFGTTYLTIPKTQIIDIIKQTKLLVPNTLKIQTKKGVISFTSLFNRDKIFDQINLMREGKRISKRNSCESPPLTQISRNKIQQQLPELKEKQLECIKKKNINYQKGIFNPYSIDLFEIQIGGTNIRQIFKQFFSDNRQFTYKKKQYKNFKELFLLNNQNSQLVMNPLTPSPPSFYQPSSPSQLSQILSSQRTLTYKHQVSSVPIPFMPKFGSCTQKQTFHWISNKLFIIQSQTLTTGIPYSDSIIVKNKTIVEQKQNLIKINQSVSIQFTKTISLQKIIKSSMEKQLKKSSQFFKNQLQQFKQQLLHNSKNKVKVKKQSESNVKKQNKLVEIEQEFDKKILELKVQNKKQLILLVISFIIALALSKFV